MTPLRSTCILRFQRSLLGPPSKMPCDGYATLVGLAYDVQRTSLSKLQAVLFQPSKQIEVISSSENKQITAWGDTRNKADHGQFSEITHAEVVAMVMGVRAFIDKHLP